MLPVMSKNKEIWKANMIKTLRITSIIAVVLAAVFFVFPVVFGVRSDEQTEQFLNSAGVIEKFNKTKGQKSPKSESQVSPLVKQAEAFALYLNPPKPKTVPVTRKTDKPMVTPRPTGPVSAKFKLIGTSYYASHPDLSLALIDEPGKGLRWVRQSSKVGHLIIEKVKDGSVAVRDGKRVFVLIAKRPPKKSLLKKRTPPSATSSKPTLSAPEKADARITSSKPPQPSTEEKAASTLGKTDVGTTSSKPPQPSAEENAALVEKIFAELENMQAPVESDKKVPEYSDEEKAAIMKEQAELAEKIFAELENMQAPIESDKKVPEYSDEEKAALMKEQAELAEKIFAELEAMHISAEEAKKLSDLGKKLKDNEQQPNQAKGQRSKKSESPQEPNSPNKK